jgi:hypothetical protein
MEAEGFVWWRNKDNGHYGYHPYHTGNAKGPFLRGERHKAIMEEIARNWNYFLPSYPMSDLDWLRNMWNNIGAPCSP